MFGIIIIQVPIVFWQFFVLDLRTDLATGSIRDSGTGMILQLGMIFIYTKLFLLYRKSISYLIITMFMFLLPIIGESKAFFYLVQFFLFIHLEKIYSIFQ